MFVFPITLMHVQTEHLPPEMGGLNAKPALQIPFQVLCSLMACPRNAGDTDGGGKKGPTFKRVIFYTHFYLCPRLGRVSTGEGRVLISD